MTNSLCYWISLRSDSDRHQIVADRHSKVFVPGKKHFQQRNENRSRKYLTELRHPYPCVSLRAP